MIFRILAGLSSTWRWLAVILSMVAGAALWITILTHQVHEGQKKTDALSEALRASEASVTNLEKIRKSDTQAATIKERAIEVVKEKAERAEEKTQKALDANPVWANAPIPDDVLNSVQ